MIAYLPREHKPELARGWYNQVNMTNETPAKQRLRLRFTRDATLKYIGHLDMARAWQRILRRAEVPLAYSEGFNPQPRLSFAAALPVGCTSDHEELEMLLSPPCALADVQANLNRALPPGMQVTGIAEMPLNAPALQMQLQATEYEMTVTQADAIAPLADRVQAFLEATEVQRERRGKLYNLRPLVQAIAIEPQTDRGVKIRSRLQTSPEGTGRPDELAAALGLDPALARIHRTQLFFT